MALVVLAASLAPAADTPKDARKQTTLGLYLTAAEAMAMWQADPAVRLLDVRTPEEYAFVGHAPMAANIPLAFVTHAFDPASKSYAMAPNPDFLALAKARYAATDTILVMCRSGQRSGPAVNKLAEAGYAKVYNVVDGFEGDPVADKDSPEFGRRTVNGWKVAGLPWTYGLDPVLVFSAKK
jgi:rhodanese-related sulfurtransferase